ncbi:MAG TPA: hypothetical protein VLS49_03750 [Usitatibacter sp.]|nr:hypothetical protein [Usitatibacter sp.]
MGTPTAPHPRQPLVAAWVAQVVGTIVLAFVVYAFVRAMGSPFSSSDAMKPYVFTAILGAAAPALYYLRVYKRRLDADAIAMAERGGTPEPQLRKALLRSLAIGGALCELPMAAGALDLFLGGEPRWFIGATFITLAIRLSYRPFTRRGS